MIVAEPSRPAQKKPASQRGPELIGALEENMAVFEPFVDGLCEAVRHGGRLLLFGEGRLHLLAQLCASEVVGRRHKNGMQLPADAIDASAGDPQAIARRIGPFDAMVAIATTAEDPLFSSALDAAKSRGAKVYCICLGKARVEGRATIAIDVPESRPHYIPGHVSLILHFLSKFALAKLGANPLIKPTRLDDGPPRLQQSGSGQHPSYAKALEQAQAAKPVPGEGSEVGELVIDLEPDEADLKLIEENAEAAAEMAASRAIVEEPASLPPPPTPADAAGRIRLIQFRCKDCREPILADPQESGSRARCPFCGRRVKVPRASGRLYRQTQATLSQGTRQVSLSFKLEECRLAITPDGGRPACAGKVEDVTPDGIEASLAAPDAKALAVGDRVELRIETPAFLEPLVTAATVERIFAPAADAGGAARARALLPLHASATREVRAKLARLAELRATSQATKTTR